MRISGVVFSGVLRGQSLIDIYYYRLVGIVGFEPFAGTLDVKLERRIDMKQCATKTVEHILMDGSKVINAYLMPVEIIIRKAGNEERYSCLAMQQADGIYENDIIEIIAKDSIKSMFGIEDGNMIEIEFQEATKKKDAPGILQRLVSKRKNQLMKR